MFCIIALVLRMWASHPHVWEGKWDYYIRHQFSNLTTLDMTKTLQVSLSWLTSFVQGQQLWNALCPVLLWEYAFISQHLIAVTSHPENTCTALSKCLCIQPVLVNQLLPDISRCLDAIVTASLLWLFTPYSAQANKPLKHKLHRGETLERSGAFIQDSLVLAEVCWILTDSMWSHSAILIRHPVPRILQNFHYLGYSII